MKLSIDAVIVAFFIYLFVFTVILLSMRDELRGGREELEQQRQERVIDRLKLQEENQTEENTDG